MKLLFLSTNIGYGGASKMIIWLANQCAGVGHDVTFITYRDEIENQPVSPQVKHLHFNLETSNGLGSSLLSTVRFLRQYIKREAFDVAIAFLPPSQIRLSLACIGLKTKLLYSHRGDPYQRKSSLKMKLAETIGDWLFSFADYFVFQTTGAQQYYSNSIQKRSTVIPNPINRLERTINRDGNIEKKIVCVARLDIYQKRQDILIKAFKIVADKYDDFILELYGDGSEQDEKQLRVLASSCPRIYFKGAISDIVGAIQNASIAVLCSDFEGIPNSLLEYMSLGIPSISTDCSPGGAAMIVENYKNGIIVKRNSPEDLASAIIYMLENPIEAEHMGKEGTNVIVRFSEHRIIKQWLDVLNELGNS